MSEHAHQHEEVEKPTEAKPDLAIQHMLKGVFEQTDRGFQKHLIKNWKKLGDPAVQEYIAQDGDIPAHRFSRWHLMNTLGDTRAALIEKMGTVTSTQDFADRCADFVDEQIDHLFFVSNDMAAAQIARDYFDQFLITAITGLEAMKRIDKEEGEALGALQEYYDVGFDAYADLREMVSKESDGVTSSLVAYALSQQADASHPKPIGKLLVDLSQTDQNASDMLHQISNRTYQEMMSKQFIFRGQELTHAPMSAWIYKQACQIADDEYTSEKPKQFVRKEAQDRVRRNVKTQHEIISAAHEMINEGGEIEGILDAQRMFDAERKKRLHMPENYDDLLDEALQEAAKKSKSSINHVIVSETARRTSQPKPQSSRLGQVLWSYMDRPEMISGGVDDLNEYWESQFARCPSPRHVAAMADQLLDELAEDVNYSSGSPAMLLHAANYLGALRRGLGERLHDAGAFKAEDFASLKRVEEKCLHYYESHYVLRGWVMTESSNAYDRLGTKEYMKYAVETGRLWQDVEPAEWNKAIVPAAQESFVQLLRDMHVNHKGCDHLLMPLIAGKARTIAAKELGEPDPNADNETLVGQYEKIWQRSGEILHAALDALPQRDADNGRKVKQQPFTADHVALLMKDLDQKIKLAGYRGTSH